MAADGTDLLQDAPDLRDGASSTSGSVGWTTYGSTTTGGEPKPGVWNKIFVTEHTTLILTQVGPAADMYMYLYSGPASPTLVSDLTLVTTDDSSGGGGLAKISRYFAAATWLYVLNTKWSGTSSTSYTLTWSASVLEGAATDRLQDAFDPSDGGFLGSGNSPWNTFGATSTDGEPKPGVWFKFHVSAAGACSFKQTGPAGDTYMYLYSGPASPTLVSDLTLLSANDDSGGGGKALINYTATGPVWLYVLNSMYSGSGTIDAVFGLDWSIPSPMMALRVYDTSESEFALSGGATLISFEVTGRGGVEAHSIQPRRGGIKLINPYPKLNIVAGSSVASTVSFLPDMKLLGRAQASAGVKILKPNMSPGSGGGGTGPPIEVLTDGQGWPRGSKGPS